jgi:hypothetical protein
MEPLTLTTPALLFPAISLLLLAYTNRFLAVAALIRQLHSAFKENPNSIIIGQIESLRQRVVLIRNMQAFGISSLFSCVLCMFLIFAGEYTFGEIVFGIALILLLISLGLSLREIQISVKALNIQLSDLEANEATNISSHKLI